MNRGVTHGLLAFAALAGAAAGGCREKEGGVPAAASNLPLVEPVVLAADQPAPSAVAVDATHVYWTHAGKGLIRKAPRSGGAAVTIYEGTAERGGRSIALDADGVYFDEEFAIKRVPKSGGAAVQVGTLPFVPGWIAADDGAVYSIAQYTLERHPKGGASLVLARDDEMWALAVDATHVYWVASDGVKRVAKTGGPVELLARGLFRFCKLALSDTDVYWGDAVLASVFAMPKAGGPARLVAGAWSLGSADLGFHRDALWVLQGNGALERVDLATGDIAMVAYVPGYGSAVSHLGFAFGDGDVFVASGGTSLVGAGPVVIDLTRPDAKLPTYSYGGKVQRVAAEVPPGASVRNRRELKVASVWFQGSGTAMQDPGNATRWIDELEQAIGPGARSGQIGLRIIGVPEGVDEATARSRADVVVRAVREKLGGTPRITVAVGPPSSRRGHVGVVLEEADVLASMEPTRSSRTGR